MVLVGWPEKTRDSRPKLPVAGFKPQATVLSGLNGLLIYSPPLVGGVGEGKRLGAIHPHLTSPHQGGEKLDNGLRPAVLAPGFELQDSRHVLQYAGLGTLSQWV